MITKVNFRVLVAVAVLCALFSVVLSVLTESFLPPEHLDYLERIAEEAGEREVALLALGIPALVLSLVAAVGLYLFWSWARIFALAVTGASLILFPLAGLVVELGWVQMFSEASSLLWGAVLALSYWSPISEHFTKKSKGT